MLFKRKVPMSITRDKWGRSIYLWSIRAIQLCLFLVSAVAAFLLRFEFSIPHEMKAVLWCYLCLAVLMKVGVFHICGLGQGLWRYFGTRDLIRVARTNLIASAFCAIALAAAGPKPFPRSILIIDFLLTLLLSTGVRASTRFMVEWSSLSPRSRQTRAFIYGAGQAGALLCNEGRLNRLICGFIDDDPRKRELLIHGLAVRGTGEDLCDLVRIHEVAEVLIAIPSASGKQMRRIVGYCQAAGVAFRTVPAISELTAGRGAVSQVRDVAVEDVLGRSAVELDQSGILGKLHDRVALVTGAAGSIGSELCRQIARFEPALLVALDISETGLFHLEQEMRGSLPQLKFRPEIGSIQNRQRLREIFGFYKPNVVYHAAAYKHVPLMEAHAFEAVENNVFGTYHTATVAAEFGVDDFVMISSDKAVRPTNIMGVTKRVAELVIRSLQNGGPRYVSVRFGNVLGSSGSVVPIFKRQIAAGGPVTVTHPEMRRYFMTIPEAAQLVLQASTMGSGGEIFVLDMGSPVCIVDLARQLILLSGLRPDKDIRIEFSGLRPGEKLCEELNLEDEQTAATIHDKINAFTGAGIPFESAIRSLAALRHACEDRDLRALLFELKALVPDYNPSQDLLNGIAEAGLIRLGEALAENPGVTPVTRAFPVPEILTH
jgi:FlaA1/EpsC-like NDP-sugar epimerase